MLNTLKLKGADDSFWWTADTHFNHKPFVYEKRGYKTSLDHDNGLIHKHNELVKPTDTLFFLGDFILSVNKPEDCLGFLRRLNFETCYMLWGNHNASVKQLFFEQILLQYNLKDVEIYPLTVNLGNKKVIFVGNYLECYINNKHIIMDHFAKLIWHKNGHGSWNLVGHSHGGLEKASPNNFESKILDVGIDNFAGPINFRDIKNIMGRKNVEILDHHSGQTT